jgi:hypothetical protein
MVISHPDGLLFAFGSNSHGQLGIGQDHEAGTNIGPGDRSSSTPTVVDRLRDFQVFDVACGSNHTLLVCRGRTHEGAAVAAVTYGSCRVYSMGLNSSGQCGLGHFRNTAKPTQISFPALPGMESLNHDFVSVHSSPLSFHSYVSFSSHRMKRQRLPTVDLGFLERVVSQYNLDQRQDTLISLREMIAESYSSISVLNCSFRVIHSQSSPPSSPSSGGPIDLDLDSVRRSYELIFSTNSEQVSPLSSFFDRPRDQISGSQYTRPRPVAGV